MKELKDFDIVDFHMHFGNTQDDWLKPYRDDFIKNYGIEKWNYIIEEGKKVPSWLPSFGFPEPEEAINDTDKNLEKWIQEIEKYNLKKACFLTGGGNDILEYVKRKGNGKIECFAHHSIEDPNADKMLEDAILNKGMVGYKILGPLVTKPLDSKEFEKTFEVCDKYHLIVNIHFGILGGAGGIAGGVNISPQVISEVVKRYPHAKFIIPHFGCGFTNDLLRIAWGSTNVYVDTSGNNLWTKWTMEQYSLKDLFRVFKETIGVKRIIFGTDSEWFPRGFAYKYLELQFEAMKEAGYTESEIEDVLSNNALRLLSEIKK